MTISPQSVQNTLYTRGAHRLYEIIVTHAYDTIITVLEYSDNRRKNRDCNLRLRIFDMFIRVPLAAVRAKYEENGSVEVRSKYLGGCVRRLKTPVIL